MGADDLLNLYVFIHHTIFAVAECALKEEMLSLRSIDGASWLIRGKITRMRWEV
jgi:hypothetical protein